MATTPTNTLAKQRERAAHARVALAAKRAAQAKLPLKWTTEEYDRVAAVALAERPDSKPTKDMLRIGQKVLPKSRHKDLSNTRHLGGKSFVGLRAAMDRVKAMTPEVRAALVAPPNKAPEALPPAEPPKLKPGQHRSNTRRKYLRAEPNEATIAGRIDLMLERKGVNASTMCKALGIAVSGIHALRRGDRDTLKPKNLAKVAEYLGVTVQWLQYGNQTPDSVAAQQQLVPTKATVFKANGHAHNAHPASSQGRVEHAMGISLDTAMGALWTLAPLDVKAMFIARMSELIAKR